MLGKKFEFSSYDNIQIDIQEAVQEYFNKVSP